MSDDARLTELSLFSGIGGGCLASRALGIRTLGYVEWETYPQEVLKARIADGSLDAAPVFSDVRRFVSEGWASRYRGRVDLVTAGFPCQPFSVAGKQRGEADERNMWPATAAVLRDVRPSFAFLENVPGLLSNPYWKTIRGNLAALGYDATWGVLGAADVGAPHRRKRLWVFCWLRDLPDAERDRVRVIAEWYQRSERGEPAAERGNAEPGDDGAAG